MSVESLDPTASSASGFAAAHTPHQKRLSLNNNIIRSLSGKKKTLARNPVPSTPQSSTTGVAKNETFLIHGSPWESSTLSRDAIYSAQIIEAAAQSDAEERAYSIPHVLRVIEMVAESMGDAADDAIRYEACQVLWASALKPFLFGPGATVATEPPWFDPVVLRGDVLVERWEGLHLAAANQDCPYCRTDVLDDLASAREESQDEASHVLHAITAEGQQHATFLWARESLVGLILFEAFEELALSPRDLLQGCLDQARQDESQAAKDLFESCDQVAHVFTASAHARRVIARSTYNVVRRDDEASSAQENLPRLEHSARNAVAVATTRLHHWDLLHRRHQALQRHVELINEGAMRQYDAEVAQYHARIAEYCHALRTIYTVLHKCKAGNLRGSGISRELLEQYIQEISHFLSYSSHRELLSKLDKALGSITSCMAHHDLPLQSAVLEELCEPQLLRRVYEPSAPNPPGMIQVGEAETAVSKLVYECPAFAWGRSRYPVAEDFLVADAPQVPVVATPKNPRAAAVLARGNRSRNVETISAAVVAGPRHRRGVMDEPWWRHAPPPTSPQGMVELE